MYEHDKKNGDLWTQQKSGISYLDQFPNEIDSFRIGIWGVEKRLIKLKEYF